MVSEADYADMKADAAKWRQQAFEESERARRLSAQVERNTKMHQQAEILMSDEIERLQVALKPFADIAERMKGHRGESPLWAVIDECQAAHAVLNPPKETSQ